MKRLLSVLAAVLLLGMMAAPVMAHGPFGRGGYGMYYGGGPSYWGANDNITADQREQLDALHKKFYDDTAPLRKDLWDKRDALRNILAEPNPDLAKARAIQNEISDIRAKLSDKRVELEVEQRKIAPDAGFGQGYGYGNGFHRGRGGYGYGMGFDRSRGGFGPGYCWR